MRLIEAWLSELVSPLSRSEIGTAALAPHQRRARYDLPRRAGKRADRGRQLLDDARHLHGLGGERAAQHLDHVQTEHLLPLGSPHFDRRRIRAQIEDHVG
jgi:hypothetical protein